MNNMIQNHADDIGAVASASAAGSAWVSHLTGFNEVLTTIATLIAIATGGWVLYDKWKTRRKGKQNDTKSSTDT